MRRALRSPGVRSATIYAAVLAVVFLGSLTATFVFTHEPQRDTVSIGVSSIPATPSTERLAAGAVVAVRGNEIVLRGETGQVTITLPPGVPKDELLRLTGPADLFTVNTRVNVGGAQTQFGLIVTGIVAVDGGTR